MSNFKGRSQAAFLALVAVAVTGTVSASADPGDLSKMPRPMKIAPPTVLDDRVLSSIITGSQRPATDTARDGARHPLESLTFWGLTPGATVLELFPGGGYWLQILAPYANQTHGRYLTTVSALNGDDKDSAITARVEKFKSKWSDHSVYGDITYIPYGKSVSELVPNGTVDLVLTARNIHNLLWQPGEVDRTMALAFKALKVGGRLAIEEHRADPRPQIGDARDGYVATATVIAAAQKAGFVYDGASEVNANPRDTKDYPFGVWTLPPERQSAANGKPVDPSFDRSKYDAIGESDRMTLRFRKPG